MRIIITKAGKAELKSNDLTRSNHSLNTLNLDNTPLNNPLNPINPFGQRNTIQVYSPQRKIIHDPSMNIKNRISQSSKKNAIQRNCDQSFLSKIGKNYINTEDSTIKNISVQHKKLNIPPLMVNKYLQGSLTPGCNTDGINSLSNSNIEGNSIFENEYIDDISSTNKDTISLNEILKTKNKINLSTKYLHKQINNEDNSLINYLGSDRDINPNFVKKISNSNENQLNKFDKICQVYFHKEKMDNNLQNKIKDKIQNKYSKDKQFCGKNLENMGSNLRNFRNVYKRLEIKKHNYDNFRKLFFMPMQ